MRICSGYSLMDKRTCKKVLCSSVFVRKSKLSTASAALGRASVEWADISVSLGRGGVMLVG